MSLSRYANAVATQKALVDVAYEYLPNAAPPSVEAELSDACAAEKEAVAAIAATPTRSMVELAAVAALLAKLVEEDAWVEHLPALARRVADDIVRLAAAPVALHS